MHVKFAELPVKDQDRAFLFYTTMLGMSVGQDSDYGGGWRWIESTREGVQTRLLMSRSITELRTESATMGFNVEGVEKLHLHLVAAGVEIKQKPETTQWNPSESSALFYNSEDNLAMLTSTKRE